MGAWRPGGPAGAAIWLDRPGAWLLRLLYGAPHARQFMWRSAGVAAAASVFAIAYNTNDSSAYLNPHVSDLRCLARAGVTLDRAAAPARGTRRDGRARDFARLAHCVDRAAGGCQPGSPRDHLCDQRAGERTAERDRGQRFRSRHLSTLVLPLCATARAPTSPHRTRSSASGHPRHRAARRSRLRRR